MVHMALLLPVGSFRNLSLRLTCLICVLSSLSLHQTSFSGHSCTPSSSDCILNEVSWSNEDMWPISSQCHVAQLSNQSANRVSQWLEESITHPLAQVFTHNPQNWTLFLSGLWQFTPSFINPCTPWSNLENYLWSLGWAAILINLWTDLSHNVNRFHWPCWADADTYVCHHLAVIP